MPYTFQEGYPSQYEGSLTLKNGKEVFLRPIMSTDGPLLVDLFNKLSPESIHLRFLTNLPALSEDMLYRFTHMNYESEFALGALIEEDGEDAIIAVARYAYDIHTHLHELAVVVRDDWQHLGLGKQLLEKIIDVGRDHGISRFGGTMDPQNNTIRQLLWELGYEVKYTLRSGAYLMDINVGVERQKHRKRPITDLT
jgi:acetyltransferase